MASGWRCSLGIEVQKTNICKLLARLELCTKWTHTVLGTLICSPMWCKPFCSWCKGVSQVEKQMHKVFAVGQALGGKYSDPTFPFCFNLSQTHILLVSLSLWFTFNLNQFCIQFLLLFPNPLLIDAVKIHTLTKNSDEWSQMVPQMHARITSKDGPHNELGMILYGSSTLASLLFHIYVHTTPTVEAAVVIWQVIWSHMWLHTMSTLLDCHGSCHSWSAAHIEQDTGHDVFIFSRVLMPHLPTTVSLTMW